MGNFHLYWAGLESLRTLADLIAGIALIMFLVSNIMFYTNMDAAEEKDGVNTPEFCLEWAKAWNKTRHILLLFLLIGITGAICLR